MLIFPKGIVVVSECLMLRYSLLIHPTIAVYDWKQDTIPLGHLKPPHFCHIFERESRSHHKQEIGKTTKSGNKSG